MTVTREEIRRFWDQRALDYGARGEATLAETALRQLEIRAILRYLEDDTRMLDVGCGNGYSMTAGFAAARRLDATGIDVSSEMIRRAHDNLAAFLRTNPRHSGVRFLESDVLDLPFRAGTFDVVVSERCLQNLVSWEDQRQAILNIGNVLKPRGLFVMAECSVTGVERLGRLLQRFGKTLPDGVMPWHNRFFRDDVLVCDEVIRETLSLEGVVNFASTYTAMTRLLPSRCHGVARRLAWLRVGQWGYNKIFLWRKRG